MKLFASQVQAQPSHFDSAVAQVSTISGELVQVAVQVEYRYDVPSRCHVALVEITRARGLPALPVTSGGGSSSQETYVIVELGGMERRSPGYEISATMLSPKYGYESVQM